MEKVSEADGQRLIIEADALQSESDTADSQLGSKRKTGPSPRAPAETFAWFECS